MSARELKERIKVKGPIAMGLSILLIASVQINTSQKKVQAKKGTEIIEQPLEYQLLNNNKQIFLKK